MSSNFRALELSLNSEVLERSEEIHTAILALIAKRHHFQIGPPGTAKSLLVNRLAKKIDGLPKGGYFHYLLTQFTVPGELYGPPNLKDMKEKGIYRLNTEGKLPSAYIAFLDEIFKGNSSILNANLTIMNERLFPNANEDPRIPLISMFAASNEMPESDSLKALWDRLHFRHDVQELQEQNSFMTMLQATSFSDEPLISLTNIIHAQEAAAKIPISDDCYEAIRVLKGDMKKEELQATTERRWMDCLPIIRAEAYLLGREVADVNCMRPLMHVLWENREDAHKVERLVLEISNPLDKEVSKLLTKLIDLEKSIRDTLAKEPDYTKISKFGVEMNTKLVAAYEMMEDFQRQADVSGIPSLILPKVESRIANLATLIGETVFGVDEQGNKRAI